MLLRTRRTLKNGFYYGKKDAYEMKDPNPRRHSLVGNEITAYNAGYFNARQSQQAIKSSMIHNGTPKTIINRLTEAGI